MEGLRHPLDAVGSRTVLALGALATAAGLTPALTRPLCPYPQTAHYSGSGSIYDTANWSCNGNIDTPALICPDARVRFKEEVNGPIDYAQSGAQICIGKRP